MTKLHGSLCRRNGHKTSNGPVCTAIERPYLIDSASKVQKREIHKDIPRTLALFKSRLNLEKSDIHQHKKKTPKSKHASKLSPEIRKHDINQDAGAMGNSIVREGHCSCVNFNAATRHMQLCCSGRNHVQYENVRPKRHYTSIQLP